MSFDNPNFQKQAATILDHVKKDISTLRTGRASAQMLDSVVVEAYGGTMKLIEVASVATPDATQILITPWDSSLLMPISKGIMAADLNLTPNVEKTAIRIVVPPLTEESRKEMVKKLQQKIESGRVMIRTLRQETRQEITATSGDAGISEDDIEAGLDELEEAVKETLEKLDGMANQKEAELLKV